MNRTFNRLVNALTSVSLDDTQCGFKAFRAPVAKLLFHCSVTERFAFDVEILSLARRLGFSIAEVPVRWLRVKGSQIRPWNDARSMAGDVVRAGRGAAWVAPVPTLSLKLPEAAPRSEPGRPLPRPLRAVTSPWLPVLDDGRRAPRVVPADERGRDRRDDSVDRRPLPGCGLERSALTVAQLTGWPRSLTGRTTRDAESAPHAPRAERHPGDDA